MRFAFIVDLCRSSRRAFNAYDCRLTAFACVRPPAILPFVFTANLLCFFTTRGDNLRSNDAARFLNSLLRFSSFSRVCLFLSLPPRSRPPPFPLSVDVRVCVARARECVYSCICECTNTYTFIYTHTCTQNKFIRSARVNARNIVARNI